MADIVKKLLLTRDRCMLLRISTQDHDTRMSYAAAIEKHNGKLCTSDTLDAGFDLFVPPGDYPVAAGNALKVDFGVKCHAQMILDTGKRFNTGFYMYPRSSLSKTRLRLANSVGIIDAGYRGNLIGAFDGIGPGLVEPGDRLLQICAPGLVPIAVEFVDDIDENTERGSGGFGSTGR
jgi:dUTP pyrophosphatase